MDAIEGHAGDDVHLIDPEKVAVSIRIILRIDEAVILYGEVQEGFRLVGIDLDLFSQDVGILKPGSPLSCPVGGGEQEDGILVLVVDRDHIQITGVIRLLHIVKTAHPVIVNDFHVGFLILR